METNTNEWFNTILSICLIPQIVNLIICKENVDEDTALTWFYESKTYEQLSIEDTKIWHYSPLTIYNIWKNEKEKGKMIYPEGL